MIKSISFFLFLLSFTIQFSCNCPNNREIKILIKDSIILEKENIIPLVSTGTFFSINKNKIIYIDAISVNAFILSKDSTIECKEFISFLKSNNILSSYFINEDSIFSVSDLRDIHNIFLYLTNSSGKIIDKWDIHNLKNQLLPRGFYRNNCIYFPKTNNIIFSIVMFLSNEEDAKKFNQTDQIASVHLSTKTTLNYTFGSVPIENRNILLGQTFDNRCYCKNNEEIVYSFSQNDSLYIYSQQNVLLKKVFAGYKGFKYVDENFPFEKGGNRDFIFTYFSKYNFYTNIISTEDYIFRQVSLPYNLYNKDSTYNQSAFSPWAVIVLDKKYNYIGTFHFDQDEYTSSSFTAYKKGFFVRSVKNPKSIHYYEMDL